jgi:Na+-driven multidrug efflux pump
MGLIVLFLYVFSDAIVSQYTDDVELKSTAKKILFVLYFSTFPDTYKGMLKGVIRALALQSKAVYINLSGHWLVNLTSMYFFAFYLEMGLIGLWISKLVLEYYIFTMYLILIYRKDWQVIVIQSKER